MDADAAAKNGISGSLNLKIDGLDCQNEVRALRAAVGPVVGGDDRLSFDTEAGVMTITPGNDSMLDAVQQAIAATGMRGHAIHEQARPPLLFRVTGLDCKNEVAALKREVGPLVGSEKWLSFDVGKGLMTVAPHERAAVDAILEKVAATGMRAALVEAGGAVPLLLWVHGLDCTPEVAALTHALGPLVGEENLAFDTEQGTMTVVPRRGTALPTIQDAVARTGIDRKSVV
jgi:Cd2+/Zn2+-exporting ATPase